MDIPKELWKEVLTEVEEEILRQLFGIPDVKLKGYRKGKAPRSAMIQQLLQPDNFRNVRYGLNFMGKKESFEIDYSNLPVEELMAAIEEKSNLYDVPMIVCHMFSSEDENVRLRGLDLWDRYKAKPNETAESEAVAPVPQPKEETAPPEGTMLKKLQKKYNDLKENREKDRKEWDKQRTNLHAENVQLKQELKQAKADLQRAEQEKRTSAAERDTARGELAEKQDKIAKQALKIIELESSLRHLQEKNALLERPAPQQHAPAAVKQDGVQQASQAPRVPIAIVCSAEWAGKLDSAVYEIEYVTPAEVEKQVEAGLIDRVQQVWMPRNDLRMTDQRMVRSLIPKAKLRDLKDFIELKKQL